MKVLYPICLCLIGSLGYADGDAKQWEAFATRFRQPLPLNRVSAAKRDQALAYDLHLKAPTNLEHLSAVASFHFQLLEYNQAAAAYLQILKTDPEHPEAGIWFAECLYHAGSMIPAQDLLERFEDSGKATPITSLVLAEIYYRQKKTTLAIQQLELVLKNTEPQAQDPMYAILRKHVVHNLRVLGGDYIQ